MALRNNIYDIHGHKNTVTFHLHGFPTVILKPDARSCLAGMGPIQ